MPETILTRFERDGVVYPIPVLSPEKCSTYRSSFSEIEELLGAQLNAWEIQHCTFYGPTALRRSRGFSTLWKKSSDLTYLFQAP